MSSQPLPNLVVSTAAARDRLEIALGQPIERWFDFAELDDEAGLERAIKETYERNVWVVRSPEEGHRAGTDLIVWDIAKRHHRSTVAETVEYFETQKEKARDEARDARWLRDEKLKQERATGEARELLAEEKAAAGWRAPVTQGLASFLADEPDEPSWHIEGLWPYAGVVMAVAPAKWGKSTLVRSTVASVLTGTDFLDRFPVRSPFTRALLIDLELTERQLFDYWQGTARTDEQMVFWRLRGSSATVAIRTEWVRRELTKRIADTGADLVIVDPLGPMLRACGFSENSNDDMGRLLDLLDEVRLDSGATGLLIPHHTGHSSEHARGASVIGDKADAIWTGTFTRPGEKTGPRFLGAVGRGVDLESTELHFDPITRMLSIDRWCLPRAVSAKLDREERWATGRTRMARRTALRAARAARAARPRAVSSMAPEIEYLVSSSAWSLGGLVVGYALGRIERDVDFIKQLLSGRKKR